MMENGHSMEIEYANSVFEQPWWLDIVAEGRWGESTVEKDGKVIARLPYVMYGNSIQNPRLTQTLGIWMDDSLRRFERGNGQLFKQKEVIAQLLKGLPKHKKMSVTLDSSVRYILPFRWHGFRIEPGFSYRIDFPEDFEDVKKNFGKHVKRDITSALNKNINVETGSKEYETFIDLMNMSFARQNRKNPVDRELLLRILSGAIELGHGELMLARDGEGQACSGAFFLYDNKVCYYLLGGQNPKYKNNASQELLLYKGIEFAASVSKAFDFEGSMVEGIENFFRKFGGNQVVNYHITKQPLLYDIMDMAKPRIKRLIGYKI